MIEELKNFIAVNSITGTDDEVATAINAMQIAVRRTFYINARTLYSLNPIAAKTILDGLKQSDEHLYHILMAVGDNDGSRGGVDVSLDATRAFIDSMNLGDAGEAIKSLGEQSIPVWQSLGFARPVDFADVQAAREN
jgi:hypothetical protein